VGHFGEDLSLAAPEGILPDRRQGVFSYRNSGRIGQNRKNRAARLIGLSTNGQTTLSVRLSPSPFVAEDARGTIDVAEERDSP